MPNPITSLFDLAGKSALVTGATGSLGSAAARALAAAGAHVTIAGGNETGLLEVQCEIGAAGGLATLFIVGVTAATAPKLRNLDLDKMAQDEAKA